MVAPKLSPKFMIDMIDKVDSAIWDAMPSRTYKNVLSYITKWQNPKYDSYGNMYDGNFEIYMTDDHIDLNKTLHNMPDEYIIRIAADTGVETPGFLPVVPEKFENILYDHNQTARQNFERAMKNVYESPDEAVLLASSTLESLIKTILSHESIINSVRYKKSNGLTKQAGELIKFFKKNIDKECPKEIMTIAGNLNSLCKTIDDLRSDKTSAHGSTDSEYIIDDPLWASFIVNVTATLGLFLWEYFDKKYNLANNNNADDSYVVDDIPF